MMDPNFGHLRRARSDVTPMFSGDILSKAAKHRLEFINYATLVTATANDAYNTLVARDLAPNMVVITSFISCEKSLVVPATTSRVRLVVKSFAPTRLMTL
jgi:hypothetical protein